MRHRVRPDHARIVRRLIGDTGSSGGVQLASGASVGGEIIFTFDGDAAGQKAALRAFGEDQSFSAQTFVAVEKSGMDPCELRQAKGPDAVRALVAGRTPLYEFVIRSTLAAYDLRTVEGRIGALRAAAPVVAGIRDAALRPEYTRLLDGLARHRRPGRASRAGACRAPTTPASRRGGPTRARGRPSARARRGRPRWPACPVPDRRDPVAQIERTALEVVLQRPHLVAAEFDELPPTRSARPPTARCTRPIRAAGGLSVARPLLQPRATRPGGSAPSSSRPRSRCAPLVTELAVAPLPEDRPEALEGYVKGVVLRLVEIGLHAAHRRAARPPAADGRRGGPCGLPGGVRGARGRSRAAPEPARERLT